MGSLKLSTDLLRGSAKHLVVRRCRRIEARRWANADGAMTSAAIEAVESRHRPRT
jgi:hypothetical protein